MDSGRRKFADALAEISLLFCFSHELAHLQRGHIDWLAAELRSAGRGEDLEPLDFQAVEMDADGIAVAWVLMSILEVKGGEHGTWQIPERNSFGTREEAAALLIGALVLFFMGTVPSRETIGQHDVTSTHPDPLHRVEWTALHVCDLLVEFGGQDSEYTWQLARKAVEETDQAIAHVLGLKRTRQLSDAELQHTWKARYRVFERWEKLWFRISPFAPSPLQPPRRRKC